MTFGTEQINIIAHNTLRIPGHFHATVVSGTAMAFMGVTYYVIPLIFRREIAFYPLARLQPYVFGIGMLVFSMGMTFAGTFGVPRRHWNLAFTGAPFRPEFSPAVSLVMGVMALGGLIAIAGGAMYILTTVSSVFFGKRMAEDDTGPRGRGARASPRDRESSASAPGGGRRASRPPGPARPGTGNDDPRPHLPRGIHHLLLRELGAPLLPLGGGLGVREEGGSPPVGSARSPYHRGPARPHHPQREEGKRGNGHHQPPTP